ncbi:FGGY-family carbohydrate kinase [Thiomicrospira sp. WB1]|uniref:FGGY-family carbohydrate kinase n=1 Tax=Thiomicrospira sp. WB1 TaxID=1685380 RepID=UPI000746262C|nr:FGGY-family carbohydrate kinase [Thiomicrospira sp. WB1]KUJ72065.1 hypothetical protein AVO41_06405 [Thiomicrospira sp. WB1]
MNQKSAAPLQQDESYLLGIDLGTSGVRLCLYRCRDQAAEGLAVANFHDADGAYDCPKTWEAALIQAFSSLHRMHGGALRQVIGIMADATSSSVCLSQDGRPVTDFLMYDDKRAQPQAERYAETAPNDSAAHGASSTLAKTLWLLENTALSDPEHSHNLRIMHQIDWLTHWLTGQTDLATDANNALKLGFDPVTNQWPHWVQTELLTDRGAGIGILPSVVTPGTPLAPIAPTLAARFGISPQACVHAGTTDSIAGFFATGASKTGEAVTSLGSTLALKLLSDRPVFAPQYGVYSHKVGPWWLAGGASNAGGNALVTRYGLDPIKHWCQKPLSAADIHDRIGALDYYPLKSKGERFPFQDPNKCPDFEPPAPDAFTEFLAALAGLVKIEVLGYQRLAELGASSVQSIHSVGGGLKNPLWQTLRKEALPISDIAPLHDQAAFGVARLLHLAKEGFDISQT